MSIRKQDFVKRSEYVWELPASFREGMQVPVRLFSDDALLEDALGDLSVTQSVNVASLPGLAGPVVVMPDMHQGYGAAIGTVAPARQTGGFISPGMVGYDVNCGIRVLSSSLAYDQVAPYLDDLAATLYRNCPSGVGEKGKVPLSLQELDRVCRDGSRWALKHGYASPEDLERTEESGCFEGADPTHVSARAKDRGKGQLGTLGSGNHFL